MLAEDMPACLCNYKNFEPGGCHIGGSGSSQWFKCLICKRPHLVLWRYTGLLITTTQRLEEFPDEALAYINGPLDVTMRAYGALVERASLEADRAAWDLRCDLVGAPRGTKIACRRSEPYQRILVRPDGTEVEDEAVLVLFDRLCDLDRGARASRYLVSPPTPPQVPECLHVRVSEGKEWREVDRTLSSALKVPPDPRRVAHDGYFKEVFAAMKERGFDFTPREIPNQYYEDHLKTEPWYEFDYGTCKFVVGPRKRVENITLESKVLSVSTTLLRDLAARDGVSYWADEAWQSDALCACKITIHAWGKEKLVEYLLAALATAKEQS